MKGVYLPIRGDKRDEADERFSQQKSSGDLIKTTALWLRQDSNLEPLDP